MPSLLADIHLQHPHPFVWDTTPVNLRPPETVVAGKIQDIGLFHNAFINIFHGSRIPPHRYHSMPLSSPVPDVIKTFNQEVKAYQAAVVHLELDEKDREPALLVVSSMTGLALALELYQTPIPLNNLVDSIRTSQPDVHRVLTSPDILRVTTSFDTLRPVLHQQVGGGASKELVDAAMAGFLTRSHDFEALASLDDVTDNVVLQVLVWTFLGLQHGPVPSQMTWAKLMRSADPKWDKSRRHLSRFHKGKPLTSEQDRWYYQVVRTGAVSSGHASTVRMYEKEQDLPLLQTGLAMRSSLRRLRDVNDVRQHGYLDYLRLKKTQKQQEASASSGRLARALSDVRKRNAPPVPKTPPKPKSDSRRRSTDEARASSGTKSKDEPRPGKSTRHRSPSPRHHSDGSRSKASKGKQRDHNRNYKRTPPRSPRRPHRAARDKRHRSSSSDQSPRREPTKKQRHDGDGDVVLPCPTHGRGAKFQQLLSGVKALKLRRQTYTDKYGDGIGPLGPGFCQSCAVSPPHVRPEECIVVQLATALIAPKKGLIPCWICGSKRHTTWACMFIHLRCSKCGFAGHIEEECHLRSAVEWLIFYLIYFQFGRMTRLNPEGPLGGKYGFGDISGLTLPNAVKKLLYSKTQSAKALRDARSEEPDLGPELYAAWVDLVNEQNELQRQLEQNSLHLQNELVRRVTAALRRKDRRCRAKESDSEEEEQSGSQEDEADESDSSQVSDTTALEKLITPSANEPMDTHEVHEEEKPKPMEEEVEPPPKDSAQGGL